MGAERPSADHDRIRRGPKEPHEETVRRISAADQGGGSRYAGEGDDPVDRRDEIRVDHGPRQAEAPIDLVQV
jgi:hypothetical protein